MRAWKGVAPVLIFSFCSIIAIQIQAVATDEASGFFSDDNEETGAGSEKLLQSSLHDDYNRGFQSILKFFESINGTTSKLTSRQTKLENDVKKLQRKSFEGRGVVNVNNPAPLALPVGHVFTLHSQLSTDPICPVGSSLLWNGYSFVNLKGDSKSAGGQDLGTPGSCLTRFSSLPSLKCDLNGQCHFAVRSDSSYWLRTFEPLPLEGKPTSGAEVKKYISRCAVCEAKSNVIAVHSQSIDIPECPSGWFSMWIGYSFMMAGVENGIQPLASPGSCLEKFLPVPFIECHSQGQCNLLSSSQSYWLATIIKDQQFSPLREVSLSAGAHETKLSRCSVCARRRSDVIVPDPPEVEDYELPDVGDEWGR